MYFSLDRDISDQAIYNELIRLRHHKPELLISVIRSMLPVVNDAVAYTSQNGVCRVQRCGCCGTDCDLKNTVHTYQEEK